MAQDSARMLAEENLADYLLGGLVWCGIQQTEPGDALADRALDVFARVIAQGFFHIPSFLVIDLFALLDQGYDARFSSDRELASWNEERKTLRLRYEREILGRLLQAPGLDSLIEMLRHSADREAQTERLVVLLLETLAPHWPRRLVVNPAQVRGIYRSAHAEVDFAEYEQRFYDGLGGERYYHIRLGEFLDSVAQQVKWGKLILEEDVYELTHWRSLSTEHLRIGCRQILEVNRRLGESALPQRLHVRDEGASETAFVDETQYPMGGLSQLTNRGSLENLVTSQLAYIEPGPGINLFDVRLLEGELLYYTRDEGSLRRKRRTIHLIYDLGSTFEWKSRGWDFQFSVLSQGLGLRLLNDLFEIFENDSVHVHFHYVSGGVDSELLRDEVNLMRLLLDDAVRHGWVEFQVIEELDLASLRDPKRKVYALVITAENAEIWQRDWLAEADEALPIHGVVVEVAAQSSPLPFLAQRTSVDLVLAGDGMSWRQLSDLRARILMELIRSNSAITSVAAR